MAAFIGKILVCREVTIPVIAENDQEALHYLLTDQEWLVHWCKEEIVGDDEKTTVAGVVRVADPLHVPADLAEEMAWQPRVHWDDQTLLDEIARERVFRRRGLLWEILEDDNDSRFDVLDSEAFDALVDEIEAEKTKMLEQMRKK